MKTAVVVLNWNGREHLEKYLPHLIENSNVQNVELILADNGSSDDSISFVESEFPQIRIIRLGRNYGFAGGYNKALQQVDADAFCILNSDVRVFDGWLEKPLRIIGTDSNIAAVQPKILSDRDWSRFEHAGAAGGYIDKYGYPFCRGRIMNAIEYDRGQFNSNVDIFWASGACLFIKSKAFWECGGFDADYFAHMEEIDLCWKLKNRGYRIVFCHKSKVFHYGGATLDYNNPRKIYLNFRNSLWTLYKNYTGNCLRCIMIRRMIIDTAAIVKFFISFQFRNAFAVIKAHVDYYRSKPALRKKRRELMSHVKNTIHHEMLNHSIVKHFFLYGHKTFDDLKQFKTTVLRKSRNNHRLSV